MKYNRFTNNLSHIKSSHRWPQINRWSSITCITFIFFTSNEEVDWQQGYLYKKYLICAFENFSKYFKYSSIRYLILFVESDWVIALNDYRKIDTKLQHYYKRLNISNLNWNVVNLACAIVNSGIRYDLYMRSCVLRKWNSNLKLAMLFWFFSRSTQIYVFYVCFRYKVVPRK